MHRDNMEVDSDSDSDTDTSFELDGRMINTIGIGMLDLPSQLAVTPGMTYDTLSALINHLASKKSLVALVQIFGPYPFLRYPKQNEEISPSVRRVYFVEKTENTSIVVVRTHDEDVVVPILLSEEEDQLPMITAITNNILIHEYSPTLIREYANGVDISHRSVKASKLSSKPAHPTIAFVETDSDDFKFRSQFEGDPPVSRPLSFLLARGEALIQRASYTRQDSLQLIHLTRALLHLIVSAHDTVRNNGDSNYITNLHRLADRLEIRIETRNNPEQDLEGDFADLCEDYIGAVAVRRSFDTFSRLRSASIASHRLSISPIQSREVLIPSLESESSIHEPTPFSVDDKIQNIPGTVYPLDVLQQLELLIPSDIASDSEERHDKKRDKILSIHREKATDSQNALGSLGKLNLVGVTIPLMKPVDQRKNDSEPKQTEMTPSFQPVFEQPVFEQYLTPGSGLGYRSNCNPISKGTLLFEERPLFCLPASHNAAEVRQIVDSQTPGDRGAFFSLHTPHQFLNKGDYQGRFLANALPCTTQSGVRVAGLFLRGARFNHSCRPNVQYRWDRNSQQMRFYAIKNVGYMEELCISYDEGSILLPRLARKQRLLELAGFQCNCPSCVTHDITSDDRRIHLRKTIDSIEPMFTTPTANPHEYVLRNSTIINALSTLHHEGICRYRDILYYAGFRNASTAGDGNNAMLWLNEAWMAVNVAGGAQSDFGQKLAQLLASTSAEQIQRGNTSLGSGPPLLPE